SMYDGDNGQRPPSRRSGRAWLSQTVPPTTRRRTRMISTDHLHALADRLGVHVQWHTGGPKCLWVSTHRIITIRDGMGHRKTRCTLAHELGHAVHNDQPAPDERTYRRQETRADRWAAGALITE